MYYYSLYIGIVHLKTQSPSYLSAEKRQGKTQGKSRQKQASTSNFSIFCNRQEAESNPQLASRIDYLRGGRRKHLKKQQALQLKEKQKEIREWLQQFDYRFGHLQLEWWEISTSPAIDESMPSQELGPLGVYEARLELSTSYEIGILRLYRSRHVYPEPKCLESSYSEQIAGTSAATTSNAAKSCADETEERPRTLAVLAVPGYMTPADFLTFTASFRDSIEHVRVVRDGSPNHYMMLLQFRSVATADEFYAYYNGKTFSPLEPETCHVVYVYEVRCEMHEINSATDIDKGSQTVRAMPAAEFMMPGVDAYTLSNALKGEELPTCPVCLERLDSVVSGLLTTLCQHLFHCRCLAQWGSGNCPVCRYSQISTFVDQERFQQTISKIEQQRVLQSANISDCATDVNTESNQAPLTEGSTRPNTADSNEGHTAEHSSCHICGRTSDLWICLICGIIGCGRYANGHAKDHFEQTQHPYSMELNSQNVWDYAGDGYVHRLLQSAADHKVIAVDIGRESINGTSASASVVSEQRPTVDGLAGGETKRTRGGATLPWQGSLFDAHEKLDAVTGEYELLLASQLESQREQYEIQLARVRHQQAQQTRKHTELERQYSQALERCRELEKQQAKYDRQQQADLEQQLARVEIERKEWAAERKRLEESVNKWVKKSTEDAKLLLEERALTRQLSENQDDLKDQIAQLKATLADVRDEVRDLTFFISTQKSLAQEQHEESEIHGASIVGVSEPATSSTRSGRGKGKRRLRK
ncbi:hypothetical protein IWW36_004755 [Coemansia brasiliensis]|uniref:BRCA1-associated protein n=1 Tax=Coemansia brasiliensis TaxID=2650707 RepID=A0A9W8LXA9_9FUNG|nr:hypothetical protein IWW36_004755 [Coemansia brasiliensis]